MRTYLSIFLLMVATLAGAQVTTFPSNVTVKSLIVSGGPPTIGQVLTATGTNGSLAYSNATAVVPIIFTSSLGTLVLGIWDGRIGFSNATVGAMSFWLEEPDTGNAWSVGGIIQATNITLTAIPGTGTNVGITAGGTLFRTDVAGGGSSVAAPISSVQFNSNGVMQGSAGFVFTNGNVGIGTTTPGVTLDVVGDARSSRFVFNNATWGVIVGNEAGTSISGAYNTAVGDHSMSLTTTGYQNSAFGADSLKINNGYKNAAFGVSSLLNNASGYENTAIGTAALAFNTNGIRNTAIGDEAMLNNRTGNSCTAVGFTALWSNVDGNWNVAVGQQALVILTNGEDNVSIGTDSLWRLQKGSWNVALGNNAGEHIGEHNSDCYYNTFLGNATLQSATNSFANLMVGSLAGYDMRQGSNNIIIGTGAQLPGKTNANMLNIGNLIYGTGLNSFVYPGTNTIANGQVGIGTATPMGQFTVGQAVLNLSQTVAIKQTSDANSFRGLVMERADNDSSFSVGFNTTADVWQVLASYGGTGAYKPIGFWTSDLERMRISAAGNVGIGTLTPGSRLSVSNAVGGAGTPILEAGTNNTGNGLLVSSNGNVAIGSRIPSAALDVPGETHLGTLIATNATFTNLNATTVNANTLNLTNALGSNQVRLAITNLTDVSVPGRVTGDTLLWNATMFKYTNGTPAGGGFSVSGNSNQIPFLNVAGTGFLFGSHDKSAPGFGMVNRANGNIGALLVHVDENEDIGLVQIGPPNPASNISGFVPSLSITNRYAGDGQTTQEMVRVNFVDVDSGSSAESFIQTWRSWVSGTPPASTLVSYAAALRKDGQLMVAHGVYYPSNSLSSTMPTAAQLGAGGFWTGNSNANLVTVYSLNGTTTAMKVLAP